MVNKAEDEEIAAALTPMIRRECMALQPWIEQELRPSNTDDSAGPTPIFDSVSAYVALALATAPVENRAEFIATAVAFLAQHPASLVLPALHAIAQERVRPYEFVPTVVERIEADAARLRQELAVMTKILSLAAE